MSTLEKLLVLGVLVLVGVILAISLFWTRDDAPNGLPDGARNGAPEHGLAAGPRTGTPPLLVHPTMPVGPGQPGPGQPGSGQPASGLSGTADGQVPGGPSLGGPLNLSSTVAVPNLAPPARRPAPSPDLVPSANPEFWIYRVKSGDTPQSVSKSLTGSMSYARVIDRANEGKPLGPGSEILIPDSIFLSSSAVDGDGRDAMTLEGSGLEPQVPPAHGIGTSPGPVRAGTAPAPPEVASVLYTVKSGDSLRKIARTQLKDERRWKEIQALNGLSGDMIRLNQRLKLPPK